jgi:hypothetical protein
VETPEITLESVTAEDMPVFKQRLQTAFTLAAREAFPDFPEVIPPERDLNESLEAPGAEALQVLCGGKIVGGVITSGEGANKLLDFIFVDPEHQDKHLGYATMCAIEARYPEAEHWELVTPYHEKRNIHFYVNRCGFHIVEFFNSHHPDPNDPDSSCGEMDDQLQDGMFRFEKRMP